ncbi:MAG TPA: hypothetical protein VIY72_06390 [Acidimicrobiales bacterium]
MADVPMLHQNTYDADFVAAANGAFEGDDVGVQTRPLEADEGSSSLGTHKRDLAEARLVDDPVTHGPTHDCTVLVKVVNGRFEMVGDPSEPWYCWPGDTDAWSEPIHTNFD